MELHDYPLEGRRLKQRFFLWMSFLRESEASASTRARRSVSTWFDLSHDAALAGLDEREEMGDVVVGWKFGSDAFAGLLDVEIGAAEESICLAQGANFVGAESAAFEADLVNSADFRRIAVRNHEWGNVLHDLGATAEYRVPADTAILMHSAKAADDSMVFDDDVAGKSAVVGKDDVVPNSAVMSNV